MASVSGQEESLDSTLAVDDESAASSAIPPIYPASSEPPSQDSLFVQVSSVGDSAASVDTLGFELYVNALADFLVAENTVAPLTCSIEGSWGSGKSSFMRQLKSRLRAIAPKSHTIDFNAWKYDKQEELWAAFALKVTRSLREQLHWTERLRGDFRLFRTRIKGWNERLSLIALVLAWLLLLTGFCGVIVWTIRAEHRDRVSLIKTLSGTKDAATDHAKSSTAQPPDALPAPWYDWLAWSPLATSAILIVLLSAKIPESLRKRLFEAQLERYIDKPDYKGKAAFVDAFSDDFTKMIEAYARAGTAKIFVFIDDLDRCEAPKAADLMQAINLMIGDGNSLIFILGLDRAKVAAAIAFKYREIIPYLEPSLAVANHPAGIRSFGDAFLEKFIQLSFRLPISSNETQAHRFIDSLIGSASSPEKAIDVTKTSPLGKLSPAEAAEAAAESRRRALRIESGAESERIRNVVMMVREVLDYSPRRIKTFLNAFRLSLYIASAQGLLDQDRDSGNSEVTPERLGKFLVLTNCFPELRSILVRDPDFLEKLENIALAWRSESSDQLNTWLEKPGVRKLMSFGIEGATLGRSWLRHYSMKGFPSWKFDSVLPSIPPPPQVITTASPVASFQQTAQSESNEFEASLESDQDEEELPLPISSAEPMRTTAAPPRAKTPTSKTAATARRAATSRAAKSTRKK